MAICIRCNREGAYIHLGGKDGPFHPDCSYEYIAEEIKESKKNGTFDSLLGREVGYTSAGSRWRKSAKKGNTRTYGKGAGRGEADPFGGDFFDDGLSDG